MSGDAAARRHSAHTRADAPDATPTPSARCRRATDTPASSRAAARALSADAYRIGGIARPPRRQRPRHLPSGHALDGGDDLAHRLRRAGAEVVGAPTSRSARERFERAHVRVGQIGHVDVVAQARAVRRRVVVAEHLQALAAGRGVDRARDDVNLRRVILAELAVGIGAGGVEIAKRDRADAVRALEVRKRALDRRAWTRRSVDRPLRMRLGDRRLRRLAVRRARRRKDERADRFAAIASRTFTAPPTLFAVVLRRLADRLADVQERGEVHHGVHADASPAPPAPSSASRMSPFDERRRTSRPRDVRRRGCRRRRRGGRPAASAFAAWLPM